MRNLLIICFVFVTSISLAQTSTPPSTGDGTVSNPYQIITLDNLYWLTQNPSVWDKWFVQGATIDASSSSTWDGGLGLSPIGNSTVKFTGRYNGGGNKIFGIRINRPTQDFIGLFGYVEGALATITSLGLDNLNILGKTYIGGLVGFMNGGVIGDCASQGTVSSTIDGSAYGGLIGMMSGSGENYCLLEKSYSLANVTGGGYGIGGLVGICSGTRARIENCFSRGNVTRIAGSSDNIYGSAFCGLLISGTITKCYSTGSVFYTGASNPTSKGFTGGYSWSNYIDNFWDNDVSNQSTALGATTKTTSQMKTQGTFTNWDFTNTWSIDNQKNDGYPIITAVYFLLPVTWQSFTVEKSDATSLLKWSTASEQNTKDFEVQHSTNTLSWTPLGTVAAAGNSATTRQYSFTHATPFKGNVYNYYRILQRDLDGRFSYSKIARLISNEPGPDVFVYPNPATEAVTIYLAETHDVRLINETGATVWKGTLSAGHNQIPLTNLAKGIYCVVIGSVKKQLLIK